MNRNQVVRRRGPVPTGSQNSDDSRCFASLNNRASGENGADTSHAAPESANTRNKVSADSQTAQASSNQGTAVQVEAPTDAERAAWRERADRIEARGWRWDREGSGGFLSPVLSLGIADSVILLRLRVHASATFEVSFAPGAWEDCGEGVVLPSVWALFAEIYASAFEIGVALARKLLPEPVSAEDDAAKRPIFCAGTLKIGPAPFGIDGVVCAPAAVTQSIDRARLEASSRSFGKEGVVFQWLAASGAAPKWWAVAAGFERSGGEPTQKEEAAPVAETEGPAQVREGAPCEDCGGTGKEDRGESDEPCRSCAGTGVIYWLGARVRVLGQPGRVVDVFRRGGGRYFYGVKIAGGENGHPAADVELLRFAAGERILVDGAPRTIAFAPPSAGGAYVLEGGGRTVDREGVEPWVYAPGDEVRIAGATFYVESYDGAAEVYTLNASRAPVSAGRIEASARIVRPASEVPGEIWDLDAAIRAGAKVSRIIDRSREARAVEKIDAERDAIAPVKIGRLEEGDALGVVDRDFAATCAFDVIAKIAPRRSPPDSALCVGVLLVRLLVALGEWTAREELRWSVLRAMLVMDRLAKGELEIGLAVRLTWPGTFGCRVLETWARGIFDLHGPGLEKTSLRNFWERTAVAMVLRKCIARGHRPAGANEVLRVVSDLDAYAAPEQAPTEAIEFPEGGWCAAVSRRPSTEDLGATRAGLGEKERHREALRDYLGGEPAPVKGAS